MANRPRFWAPDTHAERRPFLMARGEIARAVRDLFGGAGVRRGRDRDAAGLAGQRDPYPRHADRAGVARPAATGASCAPRRNSPARSSWPPASGGSSSSPAASAIARAGALHHPEFTMLEWYRAHGQYELLMDDCMAVMACAAQTAGTRQFTFRDRTAEPVRRARADHGGRGVRPLCRHRPDGGAAAGRARPPALRDDGERRRRERPERRHLGRHLQPRAGGEDRAASRHRPRRRSSTNIRP